MKVEWIGWVATAFFASSYFCKQPISLRKVQAGAAMLWVVYGVAIHALPVVAANLVVAGMAVFSAWRPGGNGAHRVGAKGAESDAEARQSQNLRTQSGPRATEPSTRFRGASQANLQK